MKKLFFLFTLGLTAPALADAQMPKWCNPPVLFDWNGPSQTTLATPPYNGGSNAAYDQNGNLLLYVYGMEVVDMMGNQLVTLGIWGVATEVCFVKVPRTCKDYYVVFSAEAAGSLVPGMTRYVRLSWNGTGWTAGSVNEFWPISGSEGTNMAISKQLTDQNRFVFVSGNGQLGAFRLTANGHILPLSFINASDAIFKSYEGELYEDANGYKYATGTYVGTQGKIGVVNMNTNGNYLSKQSFNIPGPIYGLEFVNNNQLLYSSVNGIFVLNLTTGVSSPFSNTANCKDADIEKAIDGKYYTIGVDGGNKKLVELNLPTMTAVYTSHLYNNSQRSPFNSNYERLVDQVDNENYNDQYKADLVIKDEPNDMGIEPTAYGLMTTEGNIWNCSDPLSCSSNQNPRSTETDRMHVKIHNYGCATSLPAELHIHWTRARSGEMWTNHWYDPAISPTNTINGNPGGGEITALSGGTVPDPVAIPPIAPGGSYTATRDWVVPDRDWYPLNSGVNDGTNPMICFLARVTSPEDPISNQQTGVVVNDYVKRNNNVATRNSFILPTRGGRPLVMDGSLMIYNHSDAAPAVGIQIRGVNTSGIDHLAYVDIVMEAGLYERWVQNGRKGTGVIDQGNNTVRIVDYEYAEIADLDLQFEEGFNIIPSVMLDVNNEPTADKRLYSFVVDHYYADHSTGSPSIYHVDYQAAVVPRLAGAGNKVQGAQPLLSPNPTTGVLNITYTGMVEGASITLYDNLGRKVQQQALTGTSSTINIGQLPAGLYFYRIGNGKELFEGKVVKE